MAEGEDKYAEMASIINRAMRARESVEPGGYIDLPDLPEVDAPFEEDPTDNDEPVENNAAVEEARTFSMHSARDILKEKITVSEIWEKLDIVCHNDEHYVLTSDEQLSLLANVRLPSIEFCLLADYSPSSNELFAAALKDAILAKRDGKGPSYRQCLTWLAFAAQSPLMLLVPGGEDEVDVNTYISTNLVNSQLDEMTEDADREEIAVTQVSRVIEFLSVSDFTSISNARKAILLFVISRILLDKRLIDDDEVQNQAVKLMSNILTSSDNPKAVIVEFGHLLPELCDDMRGHSHILQLISKTQAPHSSCICLLTAIFVNKSERGECAVAGNVGLSDDDFAREYAEPIKEMVIDVFEVFARERSQQGAVLAMLATALKPLTIRAIDTETFNQIKAKLGQLLADWKGKGKNGSTDEAVLEILLRALLTRLGEDTIRTNSYGDDNADH